MEHPMQCKVCCAVVLSLLLHMFWAVVPFALTQDCYTYRHDQVLNSLTTELSKVLSEQCTVYTDLPGRWASNSPQATVATSFHFYHPDIVIHNKQVMEQPYQSSLVLWTLLTILSLQEAVNLGRRLINYFCPNQIALALLTITR